MNPPPGDSTGSSSTSSSSTSKQINNTSSAKKGSSLTYKKLSDSEKASLFDKMMNSSSDYIHRIETDEFESQSIAASNLRDKIKIETIDDKNAESCDSENDSDDNFSGGFRKEFNIFLIIIVVLFILLIILLLFLMFFGVLICEERLVKNKLNGEEEIKKVIVSLKLISYSDDVWKLNMGDLLFKYNVLYAYPGLLFVYLFEEETIRILTGYKGEEKREIAREKVCKEIKLGKAGGRK